MNTETIIEELNEIKSNLHDNDKETIDNAITMISLLEKSNNGRIHILRQIINNPQKIMALYV